MIHCHINLSCNELPLLRHKLPFLYKYFHQIIIVDYDILNDCNSKDGSIEYIEKFPDEKKKIILLKDFKKIKDSIKNFNGLDLDEYQKMFAYGSKFVKDNVNIVWSTDLDEFFNKSLIIKSEIEFKNCNELVSIDCSWRTFIFNQYNLVPYNNHLFPPRITRHYKNKIYGHCNWRDYGKVIKIHNEYIYHFSYIGYKRSRNKLILYNTRTTSKHLQDTWCKDYFENLKKNNKYVNMVHPGSRVKAIKYDGPYPNEIDINKMINELNMFNKLNIIN